MTEILKAIYRFNAISTKLPKAFFTKLEQFFLICMETQKTLNIQRTLEKKWSWSYQDPRLQNIQSSYNRQNSMVLAQKIEI